MIQPLVVHQVRAGGHAQRPGSHRGEVDQAFGVRRVLAEQFAGQDPLGQVVDPPPALPAHADHVADVQQPLGGDLRVRPVPPGAAGLGAAELGGGQRALGPDPGQHLGAGLLVRGVPAPAAGLQRAAPERVVRPLLDGQHAGRVRPVLERRARARVPVGALDALPGYRAEPGVGDQLMRPGQDADRVQLDRPDPAQHAVHAAAPSLGSQKALGAQRHPPCVVGGEDDFGCYHRGTDHNPRSLTPPPDIPAGLPTARNGRFSTSRRRCWWPGPAGRRPRPSPRPPRTATRSGQGPGRTRRPGTPP